MAYKRLEREGGEFFKFVDDGDELEGKWLGITSGKYGKNGSMLAAGKRETFSLNAMLSDLEFVPVGTQVKIVLTGRRQGAKGNQPMKVFDIFVDEDVPIDKEQVFKATDDDVPF